MNPLIYITVGIYFEIKDSYMFGGLGTVGYLASSLGGVGDITQITDEYIDNIIQSIASQCETTCEMVRLISKEEYDNEMKNDEDYEEYKESW